MFSKLHFFLPLVFLLACDSRDTTSGVVKEDSLKSRVDSIPMARKDSVKVSAPLEKDVEYKKEIVRQANQMNVFLLKKDYKSFIKYANPALVNKLGGEAEMIVALKNGFKEMKTAGNSITKILVDEPNKVLAVGNELQTTVTETLEMKVKRGLLITKSVLIVISKDAGKHWYFMDTSGKDLKTLRTEMPELSEELVIPPPVQAKLLEST
ncbi:hypothetical protein CNR22_19035 [Sphingobacteriaceae bacterium]|nr:hypothetical protein CNR22_19035 [Sphingobacteriaceae bacterium]